ncbi:hypothetical protein B0I08_10563 [Glaciihabitans tibetensis]|uniref:Uncharacterized protein n=1 Tax=Glaciihabitans tibetensis TaxID=1266600 RepID=A0A2T0VCJ4_9MICO|nr:hypothetical protein [Glaciihabitans tibetensis]PRY67902.1 hypothetical protein B0I08_10563 [Glaciihabitans tibetensis]
MKGKILLVVGVGVGYVLGAKAGRERYESIKRLTDKFWHSKSVQKQVHTAEDFVKDQTKKVVSQVTGASKSPQRKSSTARPAPRNPSAAGYAATEK